MSVEYTYGRSYGWNMFDCSCLTPEVREYLAEEDTRVGQVVDADDLLDTIIEVGCGYGRYLDFAAEHGLRYVGVDIVDWMVDLARARYTALAATTNLQAGFLRACASELPYALSRGSFAVEPNRALVLFPFNCLGNVEALDDAIDCLRALGSQIAVSGFLDHDAATRVRTEYYRECGLELTGVESTPEGAKIVGRDSFNSIAFSVDELTHRFGKAGYVIERSMSASPHAAVTHFVPRFQGSRRLGRTRQPPRTPPSPPLQQLDRRSEPRYRIHAPIRVSRLSRSSCEELRHPSALMRFSHFDASVLDIARGSIGFRHAQSLRPRDLLRIELPPGALPERTVLAATVVRVDGERAAARLVRPLSDRDGFGALLESMADTEPSDHATEERRRAPAFTLAMTDPDPARRPLRSTARPETVTGSHRAANDGGTAIQTTPSVLPEAPAAAYWDDLLKARGAAHDLDELRQFAEGLCQQSGTCYFPSRVEDVALRPPVLNQPVADELALVSRRTLALAQRAARWLVTEDPASIAIRSPFPNLRQLNDATTEYSRRLARPDFVFRAGRPWLLELNCGPGIGYIPDTSELLFRFLTRPDALDATGRYPIYGGEPIAGLRDLLVAAAAHHGVIDPLVAILDLDQHRFMYAAMLGELGLDCVHGLPEELTVRDRRLYMGDLPIDVLYREFSNHWVEPAEAARYGAMRSIDPSTDVVVITDEDIGAVSAKAVLATLGQDMPELSEDERAFVRRYLPWSARLSQSSVQTPAGSRPVSTFLEGLDRHGYLLKPSIGEGGQRIVIGAEHSEPRWQQAVREALSCPSEWVIQEFIPPDSVRFPFIGEDHDSIRWRACPVVVSPYIMDDRLCGGVTRYLPCPSDGPISYGASGACSTTFLVQACDR